jgi:hypothetical protein
VEFLASDDASFMSWQPLVVDGGLLADCYREGRGMAGCRFDPEYHYHGLRCLRLANERLSLEVLPELGGKIWSLRDHGSDREVLWHSPRVVPHRAALHATFDAEWCGGWDEAFPCGAPSANRYGDVLPYLGELWTTTAEWRLLECSAAMVELELSVLTPITPARWTRRLRLRAGEPVIELAYRIENLGAMPFDFSWGLHPVQAVAPGWRIEVPARRGEVDEQGGPHLGRTGDLYDWPLLDGADVREVLGPEARSFALHYLTELEDGWVQTTDPTGSRSFRLEFDTAVFPVVWLWLVYGGWRGYHHAMAEPWTGYPSSLADAVAAGRARELAPGGALETSVRAIVGG